MAGEQDLGINVGETVKMKDAFGKLDNQLKGVAGTLHVTKREDMATIGATAYSLSEQTGLPVIIVVRATK